MKRLISILVITAMLLTSVMAMIPAFAAEGDPAEPTLAPETGKYDVDWTTLAMVAKDNNVAINNFAELYTPKATTNSLTLEKEAGSDGDGVTYYSETKFALSETTYFEYVLSAKNTDEKAYGGIVFACDTEGYPYIMIGSTDNKSDDGEISEFRVEKGENDAYILPGVRPRGFLKLDVDSEGCGTIKIVYDGYNVSIYGLIDAEKGTYELAENTSFTLPAGSKIAVGTFARQHRTNIIKNASITAKGRESAAILAGKSDEQVALAIALDVAAATKTEGYSADTIAAFNDAVAAGNAAFVANEGVADATTAIYDAIDALVPAEKADTTELQAKYEALKADASEYNPKKVEALLTKIEAALANENILQSEVDALIAEIESIKYKEITTAEEFAAMEADGAYVLANDIAISASYAEFKGYFVGNGKTITVTNCGVFGTLNGATVTDLTIAGSIEGSSSIGALATNAKGDIAITNVINNATISASSSSAINVAGFIAQGKGANITFRNCVNNAAITGGRTAGFYADTNSGSGTNNLYFYNCVNNGDISCANSTKPAAGFVARTCDGTTNKIEFENCANFGDINSKYSAGAFFGCGLGDITMKNCVVADTTVTAADSANHMRPVGGVIGGSNGNDGSGINVTIENCYFDVTVNTAAAHSSVSTALVVGGVTTGTVSIKNVVAKGSVTSVNNTMYKLTSKADATIENCIINVTLADGAVDTTANTDMEAFIEADFAAYNEAVAAVEAAKTAEAIKAAMPALAEAIASLYTNAAELADAKAVALAALGEKKKAAEEYTEETYAEYEAAYNAIVEAINGAADMAALQALDVAGDLAAAEAKLMTKAEAEALAAAKAEKITALGDKIAADEYTTESYAEYEAAYNAIVEAINGAANMDALNAINVDALKADAAAKLETKVAAELRLAKEAKLAELGEKIDGKFYNAESYADYVAAYDAIVKAIEDAADKAALDLIDVAADKAAAEALLKEMTDEEKLVVYKADALAVLGDKLAADEYTTESYAEYEPAYNAIVDAINGATDKATLDAIDVATLKAEAEAKLVTKLAAAKAEKIAALGEKKAADAYEAVSYADYLAAFDAIVEAINGAADMDALNDIDVAADLAAAEAKLMTLEAFAAKKAEVIDSITTESYVLYTGASYREYLVAIDTLKAKIEAAADMAALEDIVIADEIAACEEKLVTLDAQAEADKAAADAAAKEKAEADKAAAEKAFADAKANALIALSAKRENVGKVFTADSYKAYSAAFDALKAQIEGAADMAALKAIDIAALKVEAEGKLVVDVPAAPEADKPSEDNKDDDKTDEDADATEDAGDETEVEVVEPGCGSAPIIIVISILVVVGAIGAVTVLKKKKEDE